MGSIVHMICACRSCAEIAEPQSVSDCCRVLNPAGFRFVTVLHARLEVASSRAFDPVTGSFSTLVSVASGAEDIIVNYVPYDNLVSNRNRIEAIASFIRSAQNGDRLTFVGRWVERIWTNRSDELTFSRQFDAVSFGRRIKSIKRKQVNARPNLAMEANQYSGEQADLESCGRTTYDDAYETTFALQTRDRRIRNQPTG